MGEWISVKDKMPPESKRVLVHYLYSIDYHDPFTPWISGGAFYFSTWHVDSEMKLEKYKVTHWMPMPEAPSLEEQMTDDDWRRDTQDMQDTDIG